MIQDIQAHHNTQSTQDKKKTAYNQLKNHKIKSTVLGVLMFVLHVGLFSGSYILLDHGKSVALSYLAIVSLLGLGAMVLFNAVKFGQIIESLDETNFATYYQLGRYKMRYRSFGRPAYVILEQDSHRYYCLRIRTSEGKILNFERHATKKQAMERLHDVSAIFS